VCAHHGTGDRPNVASDVGGNWGGNRGVSVGVIDQGVVGLVEPLPEERGGQGLVGEQHANNHRGSKGHEA